MSGIGIITNPHSKLNKRKPYTPKLLGYILGEHGRLEITQSLQDLGQVARKFRDSDIEILAINGGDGTISRTLTAVIEAYGEKPLPRVAVLRGGTMNVLARNLGMKGTSPRILFRLCEAYSGKENMETTTLTSLKIGGSYGFLFADGISYRVLAEFYKNKTGPLGASWLVIRLLFSTLFKGKLFEHIMRSQPLSLSGDGVAYHNHQNRQSCGVLVASIERMPFGFRLFPQARQKLGQMQWFSVVCKPRALIWNLFRIVMRPDISNETYKIGNVCESLSIHSPSGYTYSLDGELFEAEDNPVVITPGPDIEFIIV